MLQKPEVRVVRIFSVLLISKKEVKPLSLSFYDEADALECFGRYAKDPIYYPKLVRNDIYVTTGHPLFEVGKCILSDAFDHLRYNYSSKRYKK